MKSSLLIIAALALAGCGGSGPEQGAAPAGTPAAGNAVRGDESVAAVLQSSGPAPAQLRFVIASRPALGKAFTLRLEASAATPVPVLQLTVDPGADFSVEPASFALALAEAGTRSSQDVTVTPRQAGLGSLSVQLKAGAEGATAEYVIPVLVGTASASDEADPAAKADHADP
jgi:hypothetical protein